jgi:LTXXQ motif family protein
MRRAIIAAGVVFVLAGTTAVYAQHWPHWPSRWHHSFARSTDDMSAFADARIAAVKAGLRLNPEQEKLWPPVEAAARDLAKQRIDRVSARREERRDGRDASPDELFERFKRRADDMTASAASMKKLAEVSEPLYRSLNDDQKRRLVMLAALGGRHHMHHMRHWRERTDFSAPDRDYRPFGRERDRGDWPHQRPERI